jgi:hypothetical protein
MNSRDAEKQLIYDRYREESDKLLQCVDDYNKARARLNEPDATQGDYVIYGLAKDRWNRQSALIDEIGNELAKYKRDV